MEESSSPRVVANENIPVIPIPGKLFCIKIIKRTTVKYTSGHCSSLQGESKVTVPIRNFSPGLVLVANVGIVEDSFTVFKMLELPHSNVGTS